MLNENSRDIKVGFIRNGYPEKKNFLETSHPSIHYKKVVDRYKVLDYLYFKSRKRINHRYHSVFTNEFWHKVDLFHFFNSISFGSKPWVSTFEYEIPRHNRENKKLWKSLESDSCISLLAMSHNAFNVQTYFANKYSISRDTINKVEVLYPPQKMGENKANYNAKPIITFVGNAFYHKGGIELIDACDYLWTNDKLDFHLNIVSNFTYTNWLDKDVTKDDEEHVKHVLKKNQFNVKVYNSLPNEQVLNLLQTSHLSVLPSFGETYGYAVVEAQAQGCPVITTNSWAFNEINNNTIGWILDLPTVEINGCLKADISQPQKKKAYRNMLKEQLIATIKEAISDMDVLKDKAINSQSQVKIKFSVDKHASRLYSIYSRGL